jgi:hypothetical protein
MTFITFILISIVAIGAILVGAAVIKEFRHAFTVQDSEK